MRAAVIQDTPWSSPACNGESCKSWRMKGRKTPRVKEVSMMLLTCRRESSATTQPRAGVRVNPAESAAEVSMQSSLYRADAACQASRQDPIRPSGPGWDSWCPAIVTLR